MGCRAAMDGADGVYRQWGPASAKWLLLCTAAVCLWPTRSLALRCYICENERSNSLCTNEDNLFPCEAGMDTCQTTVSFSDVSQKVSIIKTCTKNASCERQVNATRLSTPCDRSYSSWICTTCCYDDACNVNVATVDHVSMTTIIVALSFALMVLVNFPKYCDIT